MTVAKTPRRMKSGNAFHALCREALYNCPEMKRVLRAEDARRDPNLVWNEFIHLLAFSEVSELDSTQRAASKPPAR
jgi:hypothetical protein